MPAGAVLRVWAADPADPADLSRLAWSLDRDADGNPDDGGVIDGTPVA